MDLTLGLIGLTIVAGFLKGLVGFGLSVILISVLLGVGIPAKELLPILVPLFVTLDLILFIENRKLVTLDYRENFTLHPYTLMTLFISILLGTYFLTTINGEYLKLAFAILILISLFFLVEKVDLHQMKIPTEEENFFFGLIAGFLTGLFTMNAIPPSLYMIFKQYSKDKYMASLVTFLLVSDILLVSVYLFKELFTVSGFLISLKLLGIVLVGFFIGVYSRKHLSSSHFKSVVILILAVSSLKIIFQFFYLMS